MGHNHSYSKLGWTIVLNIVITVAEYFGGIISGSLALLSDAGHNFSDVFSLILGYFGEKVSDKKSNEKHSFGFKRFEVFTALINALVLVAVAFYILLEAFHRLGKPNNISLGLMLGVGSIGLFGNLLSIVILNKEKDKSINLKSAYLHLFYDTLSSVFVIVSAVLIYFTDYVIIDVIASAVIAVMILYSSFEIIKEGVHILMQGVPEGLDFNKVYKSIQKVRGVKSIHNLHIWSINSKDSFLSCHVCMDARTKRDPDELIESINRILGEKYDIHHSVIQLEENNICEVK